MYSWMLLRSVRDFISISAAPALQGLSFFMVQWERLPPEFGHMLNGWRQRCKRMQTGNCAFIFTLTTLGDDAIDQELSRPRGGVIRHELVKRYKIPDTRINPGFRARNRGMERHRQRSRTKSPGRRGVSVEAAV
jgi:hypothetical protein